MTRRWSSCRLAGLVAALLCVAATGAADQAPASDGVSYVDFQYRFLKGQAFLASGALRYRTPGGSEVGWLLALRQHRQKDPALENNLVTIGPIWTWQAAARGQRAGLRLALEPWFSLWTTKRSESSDDEIKLTWGYDTSATLFGSVRLGPRVRLTPGLGVGYQAARFAKVSDTLAPKAWDRQAAQRVTLVVWLGARERLKVEVGFSRPWRSAAYLSEERWLVGLGWVFQ